MTPRLVVFDMDGTLIDSQAAIVRAMETASAELGVAYPGREATLGIVGLSLRDAVAALFPSETPDKIDEITEAYADFFITQRAAGKEQSELFDGAMAVVEALSTRDEIILGVATGKARRGLEHALDKFDLRRHFFTTQSADEHPSKPHPSMLDACVRESGCAAETAVMIGDTSFDIDMGRAAGYRTIAVDWGYHDAGALGADHHVHDFPELLRVIEEMSA
ncbi:HAD-IA family hydrolase [Paracoccaceae bacterium GXU_MW_L88]